MVDASESRTCLISIIWYYKIQKSWTAERLALAGAVAEADAIIEPEEYKLAAMPPSVAIAATLASAAATPPALANAIKSLIVLFEGGLITPTMPSWQWGRHS